MKYPKWLYPGIKVKRWVSLLILSIIIGILGFSGILSNIFNFSIDIIPRQLIDRFTDHIKGLKFIDLAMLIAGGIGIFLAVRMIAKSISMAFVPEKSEDAFNISYKKSQLRKGPRIVAIGGGTGLPIVLHGLKEYTSNITAIVTVADDGGSSGKLTQIFKIPPPGDIRNCLVALADAEPLMRELFQYRFKDFKDKDVFNGHSFGNLFITIMSELTGDFEKAIKESSKVLAIRGQVVPVSLEKVSLGAKLKDNTVINGESKISQSKSPIETVFLNPLNIKPTIESIVAIKEADVIIFGPGSLYTSIIPNLLVAGIPEAIKNSKAIKIYVCNIMTQPGETTGYNLFDHVEAVEKHTYPEIFDYVLLNTEEIPQKLLEKYNEEGAIPVLWNDTNHVKNKTFSLIKAKLINTDNYVRHDPAKLARSIIKIISI